MNLHCCENSSAFEITCINGKTYFVCVQCFEKPHWSRHIASKIDMHVVSTYLGDDDGLGYGDNTAPFIHLNSIIASMAVTQFCNYVTGIGPVDDLLEYDALTPKLISKPVCGILDRCEICK